MTPEPEPNPDETAHYTPAPLPGETRTLPYRTPPDQPAAGPPPEIPGYEILGELGRGGMGVVYKARHLELNRVVALKMVLSGGYAGSAELARFLAEAGVVANLRHAHVVQVFDCGQHEGRPYFSMEYLDGGSLASRLSGEPLLPDRSAEILERLARAVDHAHRNGVVHRDLKPANVLLDSGDNPKLTDFGLAKQTGVTGTGLTASQCLMGTPSYMAPEQASEARNVGPAADIYGLGAILYELLTGRPPFRAATPMDTIMQVIERDPAPPRLINPAVPRELEVICLKCLEKRPEDRYDTAEELADDLRRFLDREPIQARSYNVFARLGKALERSQHDAEFGGWGPMLIWFAAVIVPVHLLIFLLMRGGPPYPIAEISMARAAQFTLMAVLFWVYRRGRLLPNTLVERQMWSVWIAYLLGSFVMPLAGRELRSAGFAYDELAMYPAWFVLAGMAFFSLGGMYWGRCYVIGAAFFAGALLVPLALPLAPLVFGLMWGAALVAVGVHLRRVAKQRSRDPADDASAY